MKRTTILVLVVVMAVLMMAASAPCATVNCSGVAAWSGNSVSYSVGQLVTYEGSEYQCIQAHTSESTWDPVDVPALWSLVGACSTSSTPTPTPVPTATATATPKPTATATATAKPTATATATAVPVPTATKPQSPTQCGIMTAGQGLVPGQSEQSCDGRFSLSMQTDSNLVLYMGTTALWATNTVGDSAAEVIMQSDGNFVLYNTSGGAIWASGTYGNTGAYVDVQTDGNLVVYNSSGSPLWASNTCCHPAPTATPTPTPGTVVTSSISINAGGAAASPFAADEDFSGGTAASTTATIATTLVSPPVPAQAVFQTERWGAMTYTIGGFTPGTTATVNLYFAEIYWTAAGQRQFNVILNGTQILTNFDIIAAAGGENIGIQENFLTTVNSSGQVVIQFTVGNADQPKISGITVTAQTSGPVPTPSPTPIATPTPSAPPPGGTHGRLTIISGCSQPMWVQWQLGAGGGTLNAPNFVELNGVGTSEVFQIPDTGLAGLRVWPGFGCDSNGQNCQVGASGGPATDGFTCPAGIGCAPPIDTKFEGSFGCIAGAGTCLTNPSGGGALGPLDWWDASFVDGFTVPVKVVVNGSCPAGQQSNGPGGPPNGVFDCSALTLNNCPTDENLSTNGEYPALANENLLLDYPNANGTPTSTRVGCFSPSGKLTFGQWQSIPTPPFTGTTYNPTDPEAEYYACPTPPISSSQCSSGPAATTNYTKMIHATCNAYAYAYDDAVGLSTCPAATNLSYNVTFYCPQ